MMNSTTPSRSSRSRALPTLVLGASLMLAPRGDQPSDHRERLRTAERQQPEPR